MQNLVIRKTRDFQKLLIGIALKPEAVSKRRFGLHT